MSETAFAASPVAPLDLGVIESELDGGLARRAAIGLVVLASDQTLEHEFRELIRIPGVAFYESRVFNDNEINPETLRAIGPRIAPSLDLILPGVPLDVVGFGCTSATMTLGESAVFAEIRRARPGVACTTPVTAARKNSAARSGRNGLSRASRLIAPTIQTAFPRPRPCRRRRRAAGSARPSHDCWK